MRYEFPLDGCCPDEWFAPLALVARSIPREPRYRLFEVDDFMIMCRLVRPPRPSLLLYKHHFTRRYLNLDDAGHAYRYIAPRSDSARSGRYVVHSDLRPALDHLELWKLPWMKPGLEEHRRGLSWDESWRLVHDRDASDGWRGEVHGRLRLV